MRKGNLRQRNIRAAGPGFKGIAITAGPMMLSNIQMSDSRTYP